jgi:hypothetical protein
MLRLREEKSEKTDGKRKRNLPGCGPASRRRVDLVGVGVLSCYPELAGQVLIKGMSARKTQQEKRCDDLLWRRAMPRESRRAMSARGRSATVESER